MRAPPPSRRADADRGQAFTLEGVSAGIIVLIALLFALQTVVLTPTTPGTVDRESRAELKNQGQDVLRATHANGTLSYAARYWNTSLDPVNQTFYNPNPPPGSGTITVGDRFGYGQDTPPLEIGGALNQTFGQRGLSFNVYLDYRANDTSVSGSPYADWTETKRVVLIERGVPTDNAIQVTQTVALMDDDPITSPTTSRTVKQAARDGDFYAEDSDPKGPLFNIVTFRVIVW
jgi:hypothetical protein